MSNRKIAIDSIRTTTVSFGVQFVTFVISAVIAALYGATQNTDVYFYALSVVLILTSAFGGILKAVFISVFLRFVHNEGCDEKEVLGSFYFWFITSLVLKWSVFALVALVLVPKVTIPGIQNNVLLSKVLFELSFLLIFSGLVSILSTVYNAYQHFVAPLVTPLVRSLVFISFVFLTKDRLDVESLAIGSSLAELAHVIVLFAVLKHRGIYFGFRAKMHPALKRMAALSLPPFLSNATTKINNFVDSAFIAPLLSGGVTVLNYANKISSIPEMLLSGGFFTVILSYWSLERSKLGTEGLESSLKNALQVMAFVFVPVLAFMVVLRVPLVELMYQRKNFTSDLTQKTAILVGLYMFGLLPLILGRVLTRAFLVLEDTWTPFWVGNIRTAINLATNFLFIKFLGYPGIAVSTSVTSFVLFAFMYVKLKEKINIKESSKLFLNLSKMVLSGILAALLVHLFYFNLFSGILPGSGRFLSVFAGMVFSSFLGVIFYIILSFILRISTVNDIRKIIGDLLPFNLLSQR